MPPTPALLTELAARYIWWKPAPEAVQMPERVVAQAMNIGTYDDIQRLTEQVDEEYLRGVLAHAEIGQFNVRSWTYWHYRLGLPPDASVPPMPKRRLG